MESERALMKEMARRLVQALGYEIIKRPRAEVPDHKSRGFDEEFLPIMNRCREFTMTSEEKMFALYRAVKYLERNGIRGDVVECGVASGGSMMLAASTILSEGNGAREIWLFDTFAGMPQPSERDVNFRGEEARIQWEASRAEDHNKWCYASLAVVKANMETTGYPREKIRYIQGRVEDTVPSQAPESIALLRLDTDWYASTRHELEHLYPRLREGGVLIIDDYGHWEGCRQATDEFFAGWLGPKPLLHRIDRLGVIGVKPSAG
jgi:O-methyltransferase